MYKDDSSCPLTCWQENLEPLRDTQEHLLVCSKLKTNDKQTLVEEEIKYTHIYGAVGQQKAIVTVMKELLNERNKILKTISTSGDSLDPSTHGCYASTSDDCDNNCSVCSGM